LNILIVSQCEKRALTETRRIMDQFAERRGDRTWQTPMTQAGLDTLRKLLRKTARKNTAVACHWIRGKDHSEILWIIGDAGRFNAQGAVPTNTTKRNVLRNEDEHGWHNGEAIHLLTALAALLHDIGKACNAFQAKLAGTSTEVNQYRHEWISLRLFEAFVGPLNDVTERAVSVQNDRQWLTRLAEFEAVSSKDWETQWVHGLAKDGIDPDALKDKPLKRLANAPIAQTIGWLIVSHHRLPRKDDETVTGSVLRNWWKMFDASWNGALPLGDLKSVKPYWTFTQGLPVSHPEWQKQSARIAKRLLKTLDSSTATFRWFEDPFVMHVSRMSLMLADHYYSSLHGADVERVRLDTHVKLFANTFDGSFNQHLDEHLLGVAQQSKSVTWALPRFDKELPRLGRHKLLRKRADKALFRWQNKAFEVAETMRLRSESQGAFVVNMASTGCGKTLANARIMYGLAHPEVGMRCAFAMGLRTLTLQTGRAFQQLLNLGDEELAIRVGDSASRELFRRGEQEAETSGSASNMPLLDETSHVVFEGNTEDHPLLSKVLRDPQMRAILVAPLLVCTIDHLTPATESDRGGRQIAPMLRLMSSDLVLDEPDDFDLSDLPALTRLVNWAGLLGSRVLLSSATLPPALVLGLFESYREGRIHFLRNRGKETVDVSQAPSVCCMWVDEFSTSQSDCTTADAFEATHAKFVNLRSESLEKILPRRKYELVPFSILGNDKPEQVFADQSLAGAMKLHINHHSIDPVTGKRVSFGLIRMANINPLVDVALAIYKLNPAVDTCIHLCTYHSQFPLILRSEIERELDQALNRRDEQSVFKLASVRQRLDSHHEQNHLFIVLGSPVTEVGRDHDYDWAVVEPSSMRSLIQIAGRIRRHREGACELANMLVFDTNMRHYKSSGKAAFCKPGFERENQPLKSHQLADLLIGQPLGVIDARPRIVCPTVSDLQPEKRFVDLEHFRLRETMLAPRDEENQPPGINAASWWVIPEGRLTALLPIEQRFRKDDGPKVDLYLKPNQDTDDYELTEIMAVRGFSLQKPVEITHERFKHTRVSDYDIRNPKVMPWGHVAYLDAITELAEAKDADVLSTARRFGQFSVPESESGWISNEALGFRKKTN
jgi:CRISPR-associated endonuclease/helicase Cas3